MKFFTLILLIFMLVSCGAANNKGGRANDGRNRQQRTTPEANPDEIDFSKYTKSQSFRTLGASQLTSQGLEALTKAGTIPASTHLIPDPAVDVESNIVRAVAPDVNCGTGSFETIDARVGDCKTKNPASSVWKGSDRGISGEGNWILVSKQNNIILWMDLTTKLIWSDNIQTGAWAQASGARGMEASAICKADANSAALGKIPEDQIQWRLPTRSDFLLADINGARFVLPSLNEKYWTALNDGNTAAWSITQNTGILELEAESSSLAVRCVGIIKK